MRWCETALEVGISGPISFDRTEPKVPDYPLTAFHISIYGRQLLITMLLVVLPVLSLSSKPSGSLSWLMPEAPDVELDIDQEMLNAVP